MVTTLGWFYLLGGTLLFFFWAYGIVSFAFDCKNKFLPAARQLWTNWRRGRGQSSRSNRADGEPERDEEERQLY